MSRDYTRTSDTLVTSKGRKKMKDREENASREGAITGERVTREANLNALQKDYKDIPSMLRKQYAADAAADGLRPSDNFNGNSMDSALQAGGRGARVANQERQNAIRTLLGQDTEAYSSATNANTAGIPGSTANPDEAVTPPTTTTPSTLTTSEDEDDAAVKANNKPRQRALKNAVGAQPV